MVTIGKLFVDVGRLREQPQIGWSERQQEPSMKATVEIVIRDETGKIVSQLAPHKIDLGTQSLHEIEGAIENQETAGVT